MRPTFRKWTVLLLTLCLLLSLGLSAPAALAAEAEETETPTEETAAPEATETPTEETAAPEATETPTEETTPPAAGEEIKKVTIQLTRTPVVLLPVSDSVAKVSSSNASVVSLTWYDPDGNAASDTFQFVKYSMEIKIQADEGYVFAPNVDVYINNSNTGYSVSASGRSATITREPTMAAVWNPSIVKHPGDEPVKEGDLVSYVSTALYAVSLEWELTSPDDSQTINAKDIATVFPEARATNNGVDKIVITHVPIEMDGWKIRAVFHGAEYAVSRSRYSVIKVIPNGEATTTPAETPAAEESPIPTEEPASSAEPTPTPTPTPEPEEEPEETPVPTEHVHEFSKTWAMDETKHWHECPDDGERADEAEHDFQWTTLTEPTRTASGEERGECSVCGYQVSRELYFTGSDDIITRTPIEIPLIAIPSLILVLVITQSILVASRRRRGE